MSDNLTNLQKIENFLSEMSEEAKNYYFPGIELPSLTRRQTRPSCYLKTFHDEMVENEKSTCFRSIECDSPAIEPCEAAENAELPIYDKSDDLCRSRHLKKIEEEESPVADLELDSKAKAILAEIDYLQEKYGITINELEALLFYRVKLSRLRVTTKKELLLEDFDHKEVRMDTLTKAVFLLYPRHPEGIRYKTLSDHQRELERIYSSITGREDLDSIRKSVADLCDPLNNSINEKVSKVKKAFRDTVDDHIAKFYYIDGERGSAKRIALDRRYVIWDA